MNHTPEALVPATPEEEEAWSSMEFAQRIKERNAASMAAWEQAGRFITENASQLGSLSLRQAFERGFFAGYEHAKRN